MKSDDQLIVDLRSAVNGLIYERKYGDDEVSELDAWAALDLAWLMLQKRRRLHDA